MWDNNEQWDINYFILLFKVVYCVVTPSVLDSLSSIKYLV